MTTLCKLLSHRGPTQCHLSFTHSVLVVANQNYPFRVLREATRLEQGTCLTRTAEAIPFGVWTRTAAVLRDISRADSGGHGVMGVAAPHQPRKGEDATKGGGGIGEGTGDVPRRAAPMPGWSLDKSMTTCREPTEPASPIWLTDRDWPVMARMLGTSISISLTAATRFKTLPG